MCPETNNPELFKASSRASLKMEVVDVSFFPDIAPLPHNILISSSSLAVILANATFKGLSELYFDERANNR